jgi:cytochrome P450
MKVIPKDGSTFDIQDFFSCLMMDIATDVFLGESTNVLSSASPTSRTSPGRAFAQAFEYASLAVCGRGQIDLYEIFSKLFGDRRLKESFRTIDNFLDRVIKNAQQKTRRADINEKAHEATFLEELVKDTQDSQRIKHDILNLLLAGKDTVTAAASNTWFVMSMPNCVPKLQF